MRLPRNVSNASGRLSLKVTSCSSDACCCNRAHTHCQKLSKTWTRVPACSNHLRHLNMSSISVAVRPWWERTRRCKRYSTLRHNKLTKHSQLKRSTTLLVFAQTRKLQKKGKGLPLHCSLPLKTEPFCSFFRSSWSFFQRAFWAFHVRLPQHLSHWGICPSLRSKWASPSVWASLIDGNALTFWLVPDFLRLTALCSSTYLYLHLYTPHLRGLWRWLGRWRTNPHPSAAVPIDNLPHFVVLMKVRSIHSSPLGTCWLHHRQRLCLILVESSTSTSTQIPAARSPSAWVRWSDSMWWCSLPKDTDDYESIRTTMLPLPVLRLPHWSAPTSPCSSAESAARCLSAPRHLAPPRCSSLAAWRSSTLRARHFSPSPPVTRRSTWSLDASRCHPNADHNLPAKVRAPPCMVSAFARLLLVSNCTASVAPLNNFFAHLFFDRDSLPYSLDEATALVTFVFATFCQPEVDRVRLTIVFHPQRLQYHQKLGVSLKGLGTKPIFVTWSVRASFSKSVVPTIWRSTPSAVFRPPCVTTWEWYFTTTCRHFPRKWGSVPISMGAFGIVSLRWSLAVVRPRTGGLGGESSGANICDEASILAARDVTAKWEEPPKTILPSSPTFGTSVGLGVNTGSTRSHLEQANVKATTLHTYQQHYAEWMRWCRQYQKNLSTPTSLEMAMIQYFDHLFFKGSPSGIGRTVLASVCHCRPDWALCLRSDVGRIKKTLKGWERLAPGNSKDPLSWIIVLALASELSQHGHFEMSTATLLATDAYLRPGEIGSLKGNSLGSAFRPMGPALVPSRRRACEQNPAARRTQLYWIRQAARGWDRWSTWLPGLERGTKSCSPSPSMRGARNCGLRLRGCRWDT